MSDDFEQHLRGQRLTVEMSPDLPGSLYDRLRVIAELLQGGPTPTRGHQLGLRGAEQSLAWRCLDDDYVVGRASACDWAIDDARLSKRHFLVERHGAHARLVDLESRNGTYVNGLRIASRELVSGDVVEAGGQLFVYVCVPEHEA